MMLIMTLIMILSPQAAAKLNLLLMMMNFQSNPTHLSDIDVYEEETEDDGNNENQDPNDNEAGSEDEDQVAITAGNATYYDTAFPSRLRRPDIILRIAREKNRKARDVRREYNLLPNSVYKNFTSQEVEAGLVITIRAGYDRDNFTDLPRLWDCIDSRPFYRATMALNRFKFFAALHAFR